MLFPWPVRWLHTDLLSVLFPWPVRWLPTDLCYQCCFHGLSDGFTLICYQCCFHGLSDGYLRIYVISAVCMACLMAVLHPAILYGKHFNVGRNLQALGLNSVAPALLTGSTDLCHCMPFAVTLMLAGGHKVIGNVCRLPSQQHASVSQGRINKDNFTCCHTETEVADQTFHLILTPGQPVPALTL